MSILLALTLALALLAALAVDWLANRAALTPPGFLVIEGDDRGAWLSVSRRAAAIVLLTFVFWLGVFGAIATLGAETVPDLSATGPLALFVLHFVFGGALVTWYLLGFGGFESFSFAGQMGFKAPSILKELGIGLIAGVGAWVSVIAVLVVVGLVIIATGGAEVLPQEPPPMIPWIAGMPLLIRIAVSASAGFFEEAFFRGFLQPRVGVAISTGFFVLAHANYEQPLMLVGIGLLSLIFAWLVRWRQNIWSAVAAHTLFDAVQLLIVVPMTLEVIEKGASPSWLPVAIAWCQ